MSLFSGPKKPYTAITVYIERLTGPEYEENSFSGIVDLIEVIRIQDTGPTEAARAIRKKLKYGTTQRQLRALSILDGLIQNAGSRFQTTFADEPLLERLRSLPRDDMADPEVREKCNTLFRQWAATYQNQPGMGGIASLYKELPKRAKPSAAQSRVLQETQRQADEDANPFEEDEPPAPAQPEPQHQRNRSRGSSLMASQQPAAASSSRRVSATASSPPTSSSQHSSMFGKRSKRKPFDLSRESPKIMQAIASSNIASTNLLNSLKFVNREGGELPSSNRDVMNRFEACKTLRREILRYIQLVESEQWIGSLLQANDELVKSLMAWEVLEKGIEDDSDSEVEDAMTAIRSAPMVSQGGAVAGAGSKNKDVNEQLRRLNLGQNEASPAKPPRPAPVEEAQDSESEPEEDEDDPFGDHAAIRA